MIITKTEKTTAYLKLFSGNKNRVCMYNEHFQFLSLIGFFSMFLRDRGGVPCTGSSSCRRALYGQISYNVKNGKLLDLPQ